MKYILAVLVTSHQVMTLLVMLVLVGFGAYLFSDSAHSTFLMPLLGAGIGLSVGLIYAGFVVTLADIRRRLLHIEQSTSPSKL